MSRHKPGISTIVTHHAEESNDLGAHITPIYQTSAFRFPDVETGASIFQNQHPDIITPALKSQPTPGRKQDSSTGSHRFAI